MKSTEAVFKEKCWAWKPMLELTTTTSLRIPAFHPRDDNANECFRNYSEME
jgi:hypothetical protein